MAAKGSAAAPAEAMAPTSMPPGLDGKDGFTTVVDMQPIALSSSVIAFTLSSAAAAAAAPALEPPTTTEVAGISATAWVNSAKVSALWSINQNRNSWAAFNGAWKKFANNSDTAIVAFTMLAGHARLAQGAVNYREEADAMVHEVYVW
jgi:hypothetical protein